jgi:DNA-binding SARP family transcriptional activator
VKRGKIEGVVLLLLCASTAVKVDTPIRTLLEQCRSYEDQGELAQAWKIARQALEQARGNEDRQGQAQSLLQMARMEYLQGHNAEAAALSQEALRLADPESPEVVRAWTILGTSAVLSNDINQAETYYLKALDLARQFGTPSQRVANLHNLANSIYSLRGQFDLALAHELEAFRLSKQYDLKQQLFLNYITLNRIYMATGRFEVARELIADWQTRAPISEGDYGYRCLLSATLALADGDLPGALDLYQQSLARAEMYGEPGWQADVYLGMSRCRRQMNDRANALDWANQALKLSQKYASEEGIGLAFLERARVAWSDGDFNAALADLQAAIDSLERGGCIFERARAALLLAAYLHHTGSDQASAAFLDAGRRILTGGFLFLLDLERPFALPLLAYQLDNQDSEMAALAGKLLEALAQFPPAPLRVQTLGGLSIRVGARSIGYAGLRSRRAGELLALLLSSPGYNLTAEQASEALAPECEPEAGRVVVYKAASELRRVLEPELPDRRFPSRYLLTSDGRLTLRLPSSSWIDFLIFQDAIQKGNWEQAVRLYDGEYLPEYRYAEWAIWLRESLAQDYQIALLHLAEGRADSAEWPQALEYSRSLLKLDPWNEAAVIIAMQAYQAQGNLAAAQRIYRRLEKALKEELGLEPGKELQGFAQSLKKRH